jgi:hypothetical protein
MLCTCDWTFVDALEIWLWTLLACDWMLSIALFTSPLLLLSSPPQPVAATAPIAKAPATAPTAATFANLLECSSMNPLLLPGSADPPRLTGPY